ncbi:MAG: hypothetical protein EHM70_03115 [Chloroflexota bacterium]|nr:MAG: hypothetical protein EHM70_03115 [Chloroflexota bacterium]
MRKPNVYSLLSFLLILTLGVPNNFLKRYPSQAILPIDLSHAVHGNLAQTPMSVLGQIGGMSLAMAKYGSHLLLGAGPRVLVIDTTDPTNPVQVSQTEPFNAFVNQLVIVQHYAYILLQDAHAHILDVQDPTDLQEVGSFDLGGSIWFSRIVGNRMYLIYPKGGLAIMDITDPLAPTRIGFYSADSAGFDVVGNTVYLSDNKHILVLDVTQPDDIHLIGQSPDLPAWVRLVYYQAPYLYIGAQNTGLYILDVANPSSPVIRGGISEYECCGNTIVASGKYILTSFDHEIVIIDPTNPDSPVIEATIPAEFVFIFSVEQNDLYAVNELQGLTIYNISDPSNPVSRGSLRMVGGVSGVTVAGNYAYTVADRGSAIVDISNPANMKMVGYIDTPDMVLGIVFYQDYLFIADAGAGVIIMDVSDKTHPVLVGKTDIYLSHAEDIAIMGNYLYLANYYDLVVLDISDKAHPVERTRKSDCHAIEVAAEGNYVYVMCQTEGLKIFDITNPTNPVLRGNLALTNCVIRLLGNLAVLGCSFDGLHVIDLTDPDHLEQIGYLPYNVSGLHMDAVGSTVYLVSLIGGIQKVSLSDPTHPIIENENPAVVPSSSVSVFGERLFAGSENNGLYILQGEPLLMIPSGAQTPGSDPKISCDASWSVEADHQTTFGLQPYANSTGSMLEFKTFSDEFNLVYTAGPGYGEVEVFIDDQMMSVINQFSETPSYQQTWSSGKILGIPPHMIRLVGLGAQKITLDSIITSAVPTIYLPIIRRP